MCYIHYNMQIYNEYTIDVQIQISLMIVIFSAGLITDISSENNEL